MRRRCAPRDDIVVRQDLGSVSPLERNGRVQQPVEPLARLEMTSCVRIWALFNHSDVTVACSRQRRRSRAVNESVTTGNQRSVSAGRLSVPAPAASATPSRPDSRQKKKAFGSNGMRRNGNGGMGMGMVLW